LIQKKQNDQTFSKQTRTLQMNAISSKWSVHPLAESARAWLPANSPPHLPRKLAPLLLPSPLSSGHTVTGRYIPRFDASLNICWWELYSNRADDDWTLVSTRSRKKTEAKRLSAQNEAALTEDSHSDDSENDHADAGATDADLDGEEISLNPTSNSNTTRPLMSGDENYEVQCEQAWRLLAAENEQRSIQAEIWRGRYC
jgi:hypothetical protein